MSRLSSFVLASVLALTAVVAIGIASQRTAISGGIAPVQYSYRVIHTYPHDSNAFTQGLEYRNGVLYEGTGLEGQSSLRKVQLETGKVIQQIPLDPKYFGEGLTVLNGQIIELTWTSHVGFVYSQDAFSFIRNFSYPGEGWGLANDGEHVYMSDGTSQIRVWDSATFQEMRRIDVTDSGKPVVMLNELEYVRGEIYANVWLTNRIARISPADGRVVGWIDLTNILPDSERVNSSAVLNGIAYDFLGDRLFVTGKLWPKLFEIQLVKK